MSDLRSRLVGLGLSQYFEVFTAEGFDTWDTILDITESDLSHLNVKLGHRRKLQRAIAEFRGQSSERLLPVTLGRATSIEGSFRSGDDSAPDNKAKQRNATTTGATRTVPKRKYRRHPKADEHAPERPPSAYVIFSSQVRESLKGQDLSFTEIAKVVGERWQVLPSIEREACERQANTAKERYYAELAEYKKTTHYETYQKYLEDFKTKHAAPSKGKRMKLETETITSTRSSSHDQHEQAVNRRLSSAQAEPSTASYQRSESSPPMGSIRLPSGPPFPSKPTSPASHPLSGLSSPRMDVYYSSVSASPRSATMSRETMFDLSSSLATARDPRGQPDTNLSYHSSAYALPPQQPASTTTPSFPFVPHYQAPVELPSRRSMRDNSARLPPLIREDTTWSSESSHSGYNTAPTGYIASLLPLDPAKTMRMLPQPVPTIGLSQSPLDRPPPPGLPLQVPPPHIYRAQGPIADLLRAGELIDREADDEAMDEDGSP